MEQIKSASLKNNDNEIKHINCKKDLDDLNIKMIDLIYINRVIKEKDHKHEMEIWKLKDSIKIYEEYIKKKPENLEISNKMTNINIVSDINIDKGNISLVNI